MKEDLKEAEELLKKLDRMERVNSVIFGSIYEKIVGEKYTYTNCLQCFKQSVSKLRLKVNLLKAQCPSCYQQKVEEVKVEEVKTEEVKVEEAKTEEVKPKKTKKKSNEKEI